MSIKIPKYPLIDMYFPDYTFRASAQDADENAQPIGRYIGFRDKNGKALYEGDVVWVEFPGSLYEDLPAEYAKKTLKAVGMITRTNIQLFEGPFFPLEKIPGSSIEALGNIYEGRPLDRVPFPVLTKIDVHMRLCAGESLADIFPITLGCDECMIKAPQFRLDDTVIYIPSINKYSISAFDTYLPSEWIDVIAGHLADQEHKSIKEWEEGLKLIYYKRGLSYEEIAMIDGQLITGNALLKYMDGNEGLTRALFFQCNSPRPEYYTQGRAEDIAWLDYEYEWDE